MSIRTHKTYKTYLEVTRDNKTTWLAAMTVAAEKVGVVRSDDGMVTSNFQSKGLNRTFRSFTFVNLVAVTREKE